jgi:biopolymer transport protein ExbB/TolQ
MLIPIFVFSFIIGCTLCIVWFAWALILLMLVYALIGLVAAVYLFVRRGRRQAEHTASMLAESDHEKLLNARELGAWQAVAAQGRRQSAKRHDALRRFDKLRSYK